METFLMITSIFLVIIVLLQSGKAESTSNIIMGGNADLFSNRKERGGELFVSRLTMVLGIIFFCLCLFLSF
jgi:preprotein translocase subunit SecG